MIRFNGVTCAYPGAGHPALIDIDVGIPSGSFSWLIGPPASGKTTMLRLLALILKPVTGDLDLFGVPVRRAPRAALARLRRRTGTIFQDLRLLSGLSVFDNVALPLRLAGASETQITQEVTEMLRWMGLGRRARDMPTVLCSTERRRVAAARAVIHRPRLLLADEPFLDGQANGSILDLLADLHRLGSTVLVATSDATLIDRLPHATLRLERGRLSPA
jgi:cell division transport system ATP-binding protein